MIILLIAALIGLPLLIGSGMAVLMMNKTSHKSINLWEAYICGFLCCTGIFEAAHLVSVFADKSIAFCGKIVLILLAAVSLLAVISIILKYKGQLRKPAGVKELRFTVLPGMVFFALLVVQTVYICKSPTLQTSGDIMLETVNSFLTTDGIYTVSPLTGKPYSGAPLRYKILCLPTIYALLSEWFDVAPEVLVGRAVPVLVLSTSYAAYYLLSGVLFGKEHGSLEKRLWFLVMLEVIFLMSENTAYLEGYGLLHGGYLGTTIRNSILVPGLLYAILEKKWWMSILCILAEVCIVWTFWGFGVCAAITGIMVLITILLRYTLKKKCPEKTGKGGRDR